MTKDKTPDHAVGYGKPPKSGQFKKGQSGNPRGRPKGSLDYKSYVKKMLSTRVTVTEDGKRKRVSSLQATLMRLCEKSLKGDMRAIEKVLSLAVDMAAELEARRQHQSIGAHEADILERFKQDILAGGNPHLTARQSDEQ
jgi:hypothetical protein